MSTLQSFIWIEKCQKQSTVKPPNLALCTHENNKIDIYFLKINNAKINKNKKDPNTKLCLMQLKACYFFHNLPNHKVTSLRVLSVFSNRPITIIGNISACQIILVHLQIVKKLNDNKGDGIHQSFSNNIIIFSLIV